MRVAFVLPQDFGVPIGGYAVAYRYASMLARRGHDVRVLHVDGLDGGAVHTAWRTLQGGRRVRPATVTWFPVDPAVKLERLGVLTPAALADRDVVVATAWDTAERLGTLSRRLAGTHIAYLIQHYETWAGPQKRVDATWRLPFTKIVIAGWLAETAERLGAGPVVHVPNAIDPAEFHVSTDPADRDPAHVAMLWHELPFKGSRDGLAALEIARAKDPRVTATLFSTFKAPADLPSWVRFVHQADVAQLHEIYNEAAIFLSPSLSEGWPLPPAEAMACGATLISTDIPGVRDYARPGVTAQLVPPGDPNVIGVAVAGLVADVETRVALAREGARVVAQEFTWEHSTDLFEQALARKPAP
jgi:glycosyltransferase involved in cell wall biosynthesis